MQILITISEDDFHAVKNEGLYFIGHDKLDESVTKAFQNAVVIPEDHGKLIDGDLLSSKMYHEAFEKDSDLQKWEQGCWIRYKMFENIMKDMESLA